MNSSIQITDVTLRDGLQMESQSIPVDKKLELFQKLSRCGYDRLEMTSFVHPKWVPQLSDADEFCQKVFASKPTVETMAFVPNERGLERLQKFPIQWASAFVAVTESFNQKNVNASVEDTLKALASLTKKVQAERRKIRIYISTVFGCPYEGAIAREKLETVIRRVAELGPDEIALSDTIGVAMPMEIRKAVELSSALYPVEKTALHLHNTYGLGLLNVEAGVSAGIRKFDGSTGGIGGCPYAKGASGNLPTDEMLYLFYREKLLKNFRAKELSEVFDSLRALGFHLQSKVADILHKGGALYGIQ